MLELLSLGALSKATLRELVQREAIEFDYVHNGKLVIYRDKGQFEQARRKMDYLVGAGAAQQALDVSACVNLEPALADAGPLLAGGIHAPSEEAGDCRQFCLALARVLRERYKVCFSLGTRIDRIVTEGRRAVAIRTSGEDVPAAAFVVALGNGSVPLLSMLGVRVPVYPLTGYSLTVQSVPGFTPAVSVTDLHRKVVYASLGSRMRIAGMVEITGMDESQRADRLALLERHAKEVFPRAGNYTAKATWCGHRPATPDSKPLIGPTPYGNLWLNTGHGALGFTLACGSARLLADAIAGRTPTLDLKAYALTR